MASCWRPLTKIAGSGSISQRYGSADPDPYQNVKDPQYWFLASFCGILTDFIPDNRPELPIFCHWLLISCPGILIWHYCHVRPLIHGLRSSWLFAISTFPGLMSFCWLGKPLTHFPASGFGLLTFLHAILTSRLGILTSCHTFLRPTLGFWPLAQGFLILHLGMPSSLGSAPTFYCLALNSWSHGGDSWSLSYSDLFYLENLAFWPPTLCCWYLE